MVTIQWELAEKASVMDMEIKTPLIVPIEYAGKWIVWNSEGTQIIASGQSFQEAFEAAAATGENEPVFEKCPKANERFVGMHR